MRWGSTIAAAALFAAVLYPCVAYSQDQKYEGLMKLLINVTGWESEPANGMEVGDKAGTIIIVMRDYRSGSKVMHIQIAVGKNSKRTWSRFEDGKTVDTPEYFSAIVTTSEYKIGVSHDKKSNTGSIIVPLNVNDGDAVFSLAFSGMAYGDALGIAKSFPWKDMEKIINNK
jgi:hypothetical protein